MFFLQDCTQNKPLATVGQYCIQKYNLDSCFYIHVTVYKDFFSSLESSYKSNPYHNSSHAADVLCSYLYLIQNSIFSNYLQDYEILASIIALLGHDVGHPGLTNRFLINSKNALAITCKFYVDNDYSVLEMMHCAITFQIMQKDNHDILATLNQDQKLNVRALIIDMILATDMVRHFDLIGKFKAKMINSTNIPLEIPENRNEMMKILTKASDVAHAAKSNELHQIWTNLICEEFFTQGDLEKQQGMPVSMYCDREKTDVSKSQAGFIKNIVLPIFESLNLCLDSKDIKENCIDQLEDNMKMWELSLKKKRVMTLRCDSEEMINLKERTETITLMGKTGRNSWAS